MRKITGVLFLAFIFVACGGGRGGAQVEVGVRSMRDVELDVIISLGDSRLDVEAVLGQAVLVSGERIIFDNEMELTFVNNIVTMIEGNNGLDSGRFEIHGYTIGMTAAQISAGFEAHEEMSEGFSEFVGGTVYFFMRFFDADGDYMGGTQTGPPAGAAVGNFIDWWDTPEEQSLRLTVISFE